MVRYKMTDAVWLTILLAQILFLPAYLHGEPVPSRRSNSHRFNANNPTAEDDINVPPDNTQPVSSEEQGTDGKCFHGDEVLTAEECEEFGGSNHGDRRKRAAYSSSSSKLWPQATVPYVINGNLGSTLQGKVETAMAHISAYTCITFAPKTSALMTSLGHNQYVDIKDGGVCDSLVGKAGNGGVQYINLDSGCGNNDRTPVHELGHALGLYHEHERPDRDSYIDVITANVQSSYTSAFGMQSSGIDTSVPYDVSSIMQYSGTLFQKNANVRTIYPTNELMTFTHVHYDNLGGNTRGESNALSHRDKMTLNQMYGCTDSCPLKTCENGGYLKPDCSCACGYGVTGATCQNIDMTAASNDCGGIVTSASGTLTSINYPSGYPYGKTCKWLIKGTGSQKIRVRVDDLDLEDSCMSDFALISIYGPGVDHFGLSCQASDMAAYMEKWIEAQGNTVYVEFNSAGGISGTASTKGFQLSYEITGSATTVPVSASIPKMEDPMIFTTTLEPGHQSAKQPVVPMTCYKCGPDSDDCLDKAVYDSKTVKCPLGEVCRAEGNKTDSTQYMQRGCATREACDPSPNCLVTESSWSCSACCDDASLCNDVGSKEDFNNLDLGSGAQGYHGNIYQSGMIVLIIVTIFLQYLT